MSSNLRQETDKGILSAKLAKHRLDESGVPSFVDMFMYGDPAEFKTYKKFLREYGGEVGDWAAPDSRRRALDRAFNENGMEGFFKYLAENLPENFETFADDFPPGYWGHTQRLIVEHRSEYPDDNINVFFDYILSKADFALNDIEALMWICVACLEGVLTLVGLPPLRFKDKFIGEMVPVELWVPKSNRDGLLSTTRYRVMDHILKNYMHSKGDRATQYLRGDRRWRKPDNWGDLRKLDRSKAKLALSDGWFRTDSLDLILDTLFHFAAVFEWYQLSLYRDGVCADDIVEEFRKFPQIREEFYRDIYFFYKRKVSRRLYNHHV